MTKPLKDGPPKQEPLKLGIAGLGTVGAGLLQLLQTHGDALSAKLGRAIEVKAVCARDKTKDRGVALDGMSWYDDAAKLALDDEIDVFVELIGGEEGPARASVEAALKAGKHVVTANKALLAHHGNELALLAEQNNVALNFEAAVAGGIPIIKTMREGLAGNGVARVYGIMNGTCNFILTKMQNESRDFAEVLEEAQAMGYAEADPGFDVGGIDTAHKLALLTTLAFGTEVAFDDIHIEGIEAISSADIEAADELGYRIKLLGVAMATDEGIEQRVHPTMVPKNSPIAQVSGVINCVAVDGDFSGDLLLVGPGAGAGATASAVMSDIADIARGLVFAPFNLPSSQIKPYPRARLNAHQGAYYIRLSVFDKPGAMAAIATHLGQQGVSLESIVQRRPRAALPGIDARGEPGAPTSLILITHETTEQSIRTALEAIGKDDKLAAPPQMIRIEKL